MAAVRPAAASREVGPSPSPPQGWCGLTGADTRDISLSPAARFFGHKGYHFMGENGDSQSRVG